MSYILLEGGAEFGGDMAIPDRWALELAGGPDGRISIIPTAAAPDDNHQRAGQNGMRWFQSLGATNVFSKIDSLESLNKSPPDGFLNLID